MEEVKKEQKPSQKTEKKKQDRYYYASQWQLMARKFRKHKLAMVSLVVLMILYIVAIFGNFFAPQGTEKYDGSYVNCPPHGIHLFHEGKFIGPFVYGLARERDPETYMMKFVDNKEEIYTATKKAVGGEIK